MKAKLVLGLVILLTGIVGFVWPATLAPLKAGSWPSDIRHATFDTRHSPAAPLQPTGLIAFHRSGQTFLTWNEVTSLGGEGYHVYRHTASINAANISQATRLTTKWGPLPEGSSIYYTERDRGPGGSTYPGLRNYVITDTGPPLTDTVGLFVWTSQASGNFYYAVTTVQSDTENLTDFAALASPVAETGADPAPVLVWQSSSGRGRVYTQFMDWATFNPTFERPAEGLQYAYNYWVGAPTPDQCGGSMPASLPLYLHIEGYGSRYEVGDASSYWCAVEVWNDDPRQSWYYGFSANYDYRADGTPAVGPIVNYAEERLLRSLYDTIRNPAYSIDIRRVYVYGHSMGGSGALALGMRYPNVFAASYSSEPMTNYRTSGDGGGVNWREDVIPKWGSVAANLPISNVGRYAAPLAAYNGTGVWDWQNHQAQLVSRRRDEMAHISLAHGTSDAIIEWSTQGQPGYAPFYQGRRAFSGATVASDHTWLGFAGMGPNVAERDMVPFYGFSVVRNETLPTLTYASGSSAVPPPGANETSTYNLNLEWSASWDNWDGAPVDTTDEWRISLRTTDGSSQTVDVTSRRAQTFTVTSGASYTWENRRVSDNGLVASGAVTADSDRLVTLVGVAVSPGGNRLILRPASGSTTALILISPNGGEVWPVNSPRQIQWTTAGSVPQVNLAYSTDGAGFSDVLASAIANTGIYTWTTPPTPTHSARVRVASAISPTTVYDDSNADFTLYDSGTFTHTLYLPLVLKNYVQPSTCLHPLSGVAIGGPVGGSVTVYVFTFTATLTPSDTTPPITYTWSPAPASGQGTAIASYQWTVPGVYTLTLRADNCGGSVADTRAFVISGSHTLRPMPDTTDGIHVFNDQLAGNMTEAQFQFAATHYAGTQKMARADADHLRTYNPNFIVLNYRLGLGLGYRAIQGGCNPTGDWLLVVEGNDWVREWPDAPQDRWFFKWNGQRVLNCDWGWYVTDLDDTAWRAYWSGEVLRQLRANDADGIFADSFSVPNYLGYDHYTPTLPSVDPTLESAWATRIGNFIAYAQAGDLAGYYFISNVGQWVTGRETTDYTGADGVMIEGLAGWGYADYFELADWQLQMNRILGLVNQDKIILAQQYVNTDNVNDRMFVLGSYLLIKGRHTYLNLELDLPPEWFPEYTIPIGRPSGSAPANIDALWNDGWGVYTRTYSNGLVLVNPTGVTRTVSLGRTYYEATPNGGGDVPANGDVSAWTVSYASRTSVTLAPNRASVLLNTRPAYEVRRTPNRTRLDCVVGYNAQSCAPGG